uniref:Uncharacterized protein n=1 Tax=Brassica oleracea TaxID=3712 RepID=A0A3P6F4P3_BRAOL|nr:unnamed protein product [Brassica oleracea]
MRPFLRKKIVPWIYHYKFYCFVDQYNKTVERDGAAGNGAEKQIIRPGTGPKRAPDQTVTVHCTGFGKGGDLSQQFWSTKDAGQKPVIKGNIFLCVIGMQIGEVARLRHVVSKVCGMKV